MRKFSIAAMLVAMLAMAAGNAWAQQAKGMKVAPKNSKAASPAISTTAPVATSTVTAIVTSTAIPSGDISTTTVAHEELKPLSFMDRKTFIGMKLLAATMTDEEFMYDNYKNKLSTYITHSMMRNTYELWLIKCEATLDNERCVTDKILPAFKAFPDRKVRAFLARSIYRLQEAERWNFSQRARRLIIDTMFPAVQDKSLPAYYRREIADDWVSAMNTWDDVKSAIEYMKKDPDVFAMEGGMFTGKFENLHITQIGDVMYEILETPHKYPVGVVHGAFAFANADSCDFPNDKNGKRRARVKKIFHQLAEDKSELINEAIGPSRHAQGNAAYGLLLEIEADEKRGKYK